MTESEMELVASTLEREYRHRFKYQNAWRRFLLYQEATHLRAQGLGAKEIATKLTQKYGRTIRGSTVTNWFSRYHPLGRNVIPLVNADLGCVMGAAIGDGSANFTEAELRFQNLRDLDFAQKIKASVTCCCWIYKHIHAQIYDVEISNKFLTELTAVAKKHPAVLQTILCFNPETARAGVRGSLMLKDQAAIFCLPL
jgi:hypothetical protein